MMATRITFVVLLMNVLTLPVLEGQNPLEGIFDQFLKAMQRAVEALGLNEALFNPEQVPLPVMYSLFQEIMQLANPPAQSTPRKMPTFNEIKRKLQAVRLQAKPNTKTPNSNMFNTLSSGSRSNRKRYNNNGRITTTRNINRPKSAPSVLDIVTGRWNIKKLVRPATFKFQQKNNGYLKGTMQRTINTMSRKDGNTRLLQKNKPGNTRLLQNNKPGNTRLLQKNKPGNTRLLQKNKPGNTRLLQKNKQGNTRLLQKDISGNTRLLQKNKPGNTRLLQKDIPGNTRLLQRDKPGNRMLQEDKQGNTRLLQKAKPGNRLLQKNKPGNTRLLQKNKPQRQQQTKHFSQLKSRIKPPVSKIKLNSVKPVSMVQGNYRLKHESGRNPSPYVSQNQNNKPSSKVTTDSLNNYSINQNFKTTVPDTFPLNQRYNSNRKETHKATPNTFKNPLSWNYEPVASTTTAYNPTQSVQRTTRTPVPSNFATKQTKSSKTSRSGGFSSFLLKMAQRMSTKSQQKEQSNAKSKTTKTGRSQNKQPTNSHSSLPNANYQQNNVAPVANNNAQRIPPIPEKPKPLAALSVFSSLWDRKPPNTNTNTQTIAANNHKSSTTNVGQPVINSPVSSFNFDALNSIAPIKTRNLKTSGNLPTHSGVMNTQNQASTTNAYPFNINTQGQNAYNVNRFSKRESNNQIQHTNIVNNNSGYQQAVGNQQNIRQVVNRNSPINSNSQVNNNMNNKVKVPKRKPHVNNKILDNMQGQIAKENIINQASKAIGPQANSDMHGSISTLQDLNNGGMNFNTFAQSIASGYSQSIAGNTHDRTSNTQVVNVASPSVHSPSVHNQQAASQNINLQQIGLQNALVNQMSRFYHEVVEYFVRDTTTGGTTKESSEMITPSLQHVRNEAYNIELYIDMGQGVFLLYSDACWFGYNTEHTQFIQAINNVTKNVQMGGMVYKRPTTLNAVAQPMTSNAIPTLSPAIFEQKQCDGGKPTFYITPSKAQGSFNSIFGQQCFRFAAANMCISNGGSQVMPMVQSLPLLF